MRTMLSGRPSILCPFALLAATVAMAPVVAAAADEDFYTTEKVYNSRPNAGGGKPFGHVGPTGIVAYIHPGVRVTVEGITPASPAAGKFAKGDVITGVNGTSLKGLNPYVALGEAITRAEATDGKLVFDIERGEAAQQVTVTIPVLGAYSDTWPVDCDKSKRIVERAAAHYRKALAEHKGHSIEGALMCLFLLSTGDDAHLPVVKGYFGQFLDHPAGVGDNTWMNGYNGVACGEYYLRTGDRDVLPLMRAYCDDAKQRQKFGVGWPHWGQGINPRYVAGGLMNPASAQVLTTLLLAKECGVDVDDDTLVGSLRFFYRFVGHGTVPYGDHRGEGGLGSNGKDGMIAAAMQVAAGANGDTSIYRSARDYLSMSTLKSYPNLATGHGDNGRGDGIWRGMSAVYLKDIKPADYRGMMDRLTWWYDLSRFHNGAMGMATVGGFNDAGSGAAVAIAYTAHLKHLRILGAPRSKHAADFNLPQHLWGRPADLAFHGIDHLPQFSRFGNESPPHRLLAMLGNAYQSPGDGGAAVEQVRQNLYHHRYMFRSQAAKALVQRGELDQVAQLLSHEDPRVRRAALDGIYDWRYWHGMGRNPLKPEQFTPGMTAAITAMLDDPDEALYVVEGALFAMHHMPADVIAAHRDRIMPWTTHGDWWLREASFMALQGLAKDQARYAEVLPTLIDMFISEYHTMPRQRMNGQLSRTLRRVGVDSDAGKLIVAGYKRATSQSEIKPGDRAREGSYNVIESVKVVIGLDPAAAVPAAAMLRDRFDVLDTGRILQAVSRSGGKRDGFFPILGELNEADRNALTDILYHGYLPELVERLKAEQGVNLELIDTVLALKRLKEDVDGWRVLGTPAPAKRVWRFTSIDPPTEDEQQHPRERKRFRDITLPDRFAGWYEPDFDAGDWNTGPAPIGKGEFKQRDRHFENRSEWGPGEFLLARTTFEVDQLDYDLYRLRVLANQGYHVYLNGKKVHTYVWWKDEPRYWRLNLSQQNANLLKKGTNTLALYANTEYPSAMKPHRWTQKEQAQIDCRIEGLRKSDLY